MPDIFINTERPVDRSIVAGINQPQREAPAGAYVAGSSYDVNIYFILNSGAYDAASGDAGTDVQLAISPISEPHSGTWTLTDGTDTTTALDYGASAQEVEDALNALNSDTGPNLGTASLVDVVKQSDTQYTITWRTLGAMTALSGASVSLFPESDVTGSIAVNGDGSEYAQQVIELTRQPAVYQQTWSTIANGHNATVALNTTRLLQAMVLERGQPWYLEVKLDGETVAREVISVEESNMPASAFSGVAIQSLLDAFAADPTANANFDAPTWLAQLGGLTEVNDLTASVTWANVPDANITESSVTQHQAALALATSQLTSGTLADARVAKSNVTQYVPAEVGGTGVVSGGILSVGTPNTTFSITDGTGYITDQNGNLTSVSWSGKTNITPANLATNLLTWVAIDSGGNVVEQTSAFTPTQARANIVLGVVVHTDLATVQTVNVEILPYANVANQVYDLSEAIGFINVSGNVFGPSIVTPSSLKFSKSSGSIWKFGSNADASFTNPHIKALAAADTASGGGFPNIFQYRFNDGTSGPLTDTDIDPDNLDDGAGGLTALANNRWSVQRIYTFVSGNIKIQRGIESFSTKAAAIEGIASENYTTENSIAANGVLRGFLVVQEGSTDLSDSAQAQFIAAPKFGEGSTGGASTPPGDASAVLLTCKKATAGTLAVGDVVRTTGYSAPDILCELADADAAGEMPAIGVVREAATDTTAGVIVFTGVLANVDTSAYSVGDALYVSTTPGQFTNTKPTALGSGIQKIAKVLSVDASAGVIQVVGAGRSNDIPNFTAADKYWYGDGTGASVEGTISAAGRAILDDADAAAQRTTLSAQEDISGATLTAVTVASADKVLVQDADDSDNLKTVTAQSIAELTGSGLTLVDKTADANITAVAGEMHVVEMNSGTPFTASRNWTLPVAASVSTGDKFGLMIKDGDAAFEVNVRTGSSGDLLNGVDISAASNEWELFQQGEVLIVTCIDGATADYIVEYDGRLACHARLEKTNAQTMAEFAFDQIEYNSEAHNIGMTTDTSTSWDIIVRRKGYYQITAHTALSDAELTFVNNDFFYNALHIDGLSDNELQLAGAGATSTNQLAASFVSEKSLDAGKAVSMSTFVNGTTGADLFLTNRKNYLSVTEII